MNEKSKRIFCFLFAVMTFAFSFSAAVSASPYSKDIASNNAVIYNIENSAAVYQKNSGEKIAPGPTAKIMTGILALEYFADNLDREITVRSAALKNIEGSAVLSLKTGEVITVRDLIYATLVGGCSDAANTLAVEIAGSIAGFVRMMNEKAAAIGAVSTCYINATGLDGDGAYTTALDTAKIAAYAYNVAGFIDISSTKSYKIAATNKSDARTVYTKNYLLSSQTQYLYIYSKAEGISTGFTDNAGYCVITSASERSFTYICVAMNSSKNAAGEISAYYDAKNLLEWALDEYETKKLCDTSMVAGEISVTLSKGSGYVTAVPQNNVYAYLPKDADMQSVEKSVELYINTLEAPVSRGMVIGKMTFTLDGKTVAECNIVTKSSVMRSGWLSFLKSVSGAFSSKTFLYSVFILIGFCVIFAIVRIFFIFNKAKIRK